jgi:hypothetical protein
MLVILSLIALNLPTDTIPAYIKKLPILYQDNPLLYTDSFEGDSIAPFWYKELWGRKAGYISTKHKRAGKQAICVSWKSDQVDGTNKMLHSELATRPIQPNELPERWYGYSSYMPSASMANDSKPVIISQWHAAPDKGEAHTVPH